MISSVPAAFPSPVQPVERGQSQAIRSEQAARAEQAVGQQAKAAVTAARETNDTLPKNSQGLAASAIARGIDPSSLFQALVTPPTEEVAPAGDSVPAAEQVETISPAPAFAPAAPKTEEVATSTEAVDDEATNRLTTALESLKQVTADAQEGLIDQLL